MGSELFTLNVAPHKGKISILSLWYKILRWQRDMQLHLQENVLNETGCIMNVCLDCWGLKGVN